MGKGWRIGLGHPRRMRTILLTGVRGNTGRHVAALLADRRDVAVRGGTRDPSAVRMPGVTPVRFDWLDPGTWTAAAAGVDAVYLARPEIEDAPERIAAFLDAGVRTVVLLSDNIHGDDVPAARWEAQVEAAVTERAVAWTLLRPTWFHQTLTEERYFLPPIRDRGELEIPSAGAAICYVDARDIAELAVAALDGGHDGRTYELTGTRAVTLDDLATRLTAAAGHPVRHIDGPLDDAARALAGGDPWYGEYLHYVWSRMRAGTAASVSDDIERVLGRPPRSLDAFLDEHATAWRR